MTKIHGLVYLVIGVIVTIVAFQLPKLFIFFWFGLFLIAIGIYKITVSYILGGKGKKDTKMLTPPHFPCPRCRTLVYKTANYCYVCGNQLKE